MPLMKNLLHVVPGQTPCSEANETNLPYGMHDNADTVSRGVVLDADIPGSCDLCDFTIAMVHLA